MTKRHNKFIDTSQVQLTEVLTMWSSSVCLKICELQLHHYHPRQYHLNCSSLRYAVNFKYELHVFIKLLTGDPKKWEFTQVCFRNKKYQNNKSLSGGFTGCHGRKIYILVLFQTQQNIVVCNHQYPQLQLFSFLFTSNSLTPLRQNQELLPCAEILQLWYAYFQICCSVLKDHNTKANASNTSAED